MWIAAIIIAFSSWDSDKIKWSELMYAAILKLCTLTVTTSGLFVSVFIFLNDAS